ncbi:vWA domain-containing protein [Lentzea guizhouensis]|nr:vWA domain-containing protein [Lentzea guizhouensis]
MWNEKLWPDKASSPLAVMNDSLGLMLEVLAEDIEASDIGRVAVITFADDAATHYPLTPIADPGRLDPLPRGEWTNYVSAWEHLNTTIRADIDQMVAQRCRPKQPVVFFITDGNAGHSKHTQTVAEWSMPRNRLCSPGYGFRPRVVALGIGNVDRATVRALRSVDPPGAAFLANPGEPASILLQAIIKVIIVSITTSTAQGYFTFPTPVGMTRLDDSAV